MQQNNDVLLKVDNLCQYFKLGNSTLKAVDHISFEVKKGEVFGLVGESGCGKTTTGRTIIKLYEATSGSVYFENRRIVAGTGGYKSAIKAARRELKTFVKETKKQMEEEIAANPTSEATIKEKFETLIKEKTQETHEFITSQKKEIKSAIHDQKYCNKDYANENLVLLDEKYKPLLEKATTEEEKAEINKQYKEEVRLIKKERLVNKIQMIFQDPIASLDPRMTVKDIIAEGLVIRGVKDKEWIDEKVYEVLELVGLVKEHADRYPHEFSGGQRQRIGIARAIIMNPEMIIADEPVSALDVSVQAQVLNLLNDLRNKLGLTILFIAHNLSVVKYFSDRIGVMYFGKMVEMTTADELFKHPLHPYTRSLLSAIPLPDPTYEKQRQRFAYNPLAEHDYSTEQPTFQEVIPGHFVLCNSVELEKYRNTIKEIDSKDEENSK